MSDDAYYQLHVFCCTNRREDGHKRGSCAASGAEDLQKYMKARAKELGITQARINKAGCLDRCECGPVMVLYPQGLWYHYESEGDIDRILAAHQAGEVVDDLLLKKDQDSWSE